MNPSTNPAYFVAGGTLPATAPSYVERQADEDLYAALARGDFCYVLTARQMGKSSLMVRTAVRLREEGFRVVVLDLTAVGKPATSEPWYAGLLRRMSRQLGLEQELNEFWSAHGELGPLQRWMATLEEVVLPKLKEGASALPLASNPLPSGPSEEKERRESIVKGPTSERLIIFVDEIDYVRSLPFSTDEFFAAIRECYSRRSEDPEFNRLTFCLLGVAVPSDLIRDMRSTPFNIGQRIELHDFTETEAAPLARGLGRDTNAAETVLKRILHWTHGHPYLTQRLCHEIVQSPQALNTGGVDRTCGNLFFSSHAKANDPNLLFVRDGLLRSEAELGGLLGLYEQVLRGKRITDDGTKPLVSTLRLSGIARIAAGFLRVRNRIYASAFDRAWVRENMPDAEVRRQRTAFWRGVVRTAGIGVPIVAVMCYLVLLAKQGMQAAGEEREAANRARQVAEHQREENRKQLVRQYIDAGMRLADEGDLFDSLSWFAKSLDLDNGDWAREEMHRLRIQSFLQRCPKLFQVFFHESGVNFAEFSPDTASIGTASADATARVWDVASGHPVTPVLRHAGSVNSIRFSLDGRQVVTASEDGTARLWDAVTGKPVGEPLQHRSAVRDAVLSPDSRWILTVSGNAAQVWDAASGKPVGDALQHLKSVTHAEFSPDGQHVLTASDDNTARVWDASSGKPAGPPMKHTYYVAYATFSPEGSKVLTSSYDYSARIWDWQTGKMLTAPLKHQNWVRYAVFSPDGRRIITTSSDHTARIWDPATGNPITAPLKHTGSIRHAAFSPDSLRVVAGSNDGTARVWDALSGKALSPPLKHLKEVTRVGFSADGRFIFSASADGMVRLWDLATGESLLPPLKHGGPVLISSFSPDGQRIVTASGDQTARVWDSITGLPLSAPLSHGHWVYHASFSPDGQWVITASDDKTAQVWDVKTGRPRFSPSLRHNASVRWAEFSPDGTQVITAAYDGTARIWSAIDGRELRPPSPLRHTDPVRTAVFSPDGRRILTASGPESGPGEARVWDAKTGRPIGTAMPHRDHVRKAFFSPAGDRIVTASEDGSARVWDATTGAPLTPFIKHGAPVSVALFSPDGQRILTASSDGTARLWSVDDARPLTPPMTHRDRVGSAQFSLDGRLVATVSYDQTARVWDSRTGEPLTPPFKHDREVIRAAFSPDGTRLVTASSDWTARVWQLPGQERETPDPTMLASLLSGKVVDSTGGYVPLEIAGFKTNWQALRARYPSQFTASTQEALAWHQHEAQVCQNAGKWKEGAIQLRKLLELDPGNKGLQDELVHLQTALVATNKSSIPRRDTNATPSLIDLSKYYTEVIFDKHPGTLPFPTGTQTMGGIQFDIRGIVDLENVQPPEVRRIPVNLKARRIHLLHGTSGKEPPGTEIARWVLNYGNGTRLEFPILFGQDLREWTARSEMEATNAERVVWTGINGTPSDKFLAYRRTWENPLPDQTIQSIDYLSTMTRCVPFLIAITMEP